MKREEALRIIKECKEKGFKHTFYTLNEYHTALDIAVKALEQELCTDAVSRQDAINANCYNCSIKANGGKCSKCDAVKAIEYLPPVNLQPKTGHWIDTDEWRETVDGFEQWGYFRKCSECGYVFKFLEIDNYCPNCGAKMIEPQESEDKCKNCEYYHNPDYTRCHECKAESEVEE